MTARQAQSPVTRHDLLRTQARILALEEKVGDLEKRLARLLRELNKGADDDIC
jgi:hypothetical protein